MSAQTLLVDRGVPHASSDALELSRAALNAAQAEDGKSFIGDDFTVGAAGEVWIVDTIRTWAVVESDPGPLYEKITLYGGLAGQPPPKDQPDCFCNGMATLITAGPKDSPDVSVSTLDDAEGAIYNETGKPFRVLRLEFRNLLWSVPGGVAIQFAVKADSTHTWLNHVSNVKAGHRLRVFDGAGQLKSFLAGNENVGLNIQVWGHAFASGRAEAPGNR